MKTPPRVMAIHDLSGVGKCSLTVALPILSAMGVEAAALPTAVLSTHTGGFDGYTCRDLTDDMLPMAAHWQSLGLAFDALYSGWLGSAAQADIVLTLYGMFAQAGALRLVDPVMGDNGRLYGTYTPERVRGMARLCRRAELITPNLTEACLLLDEPYHERVLSPAEARGFCERLTELGPGRVVITGISTGQHALGAAAWDAPGGAFSLHDMPRVPGVWHGTGDVFCSVLLGGLLRGGTLGKAAGMAVSFTHGCIARTRRQGTDPRLGVNFERGLAALAAELDGGGA